MNSSVKSIIQSVEGMVGRGQRDQAFNTIKDALRYYPRDARLWYWLARCVENPAHASDALRRALQFDPSLEEAQEFFVWIQTGGEPMQWAPSMEEPPATPDPVTPQWSLLNELGGDDEEDEEYGVDGTLTLPNTSVPAVRKEEFAFLAEMESQLPTATLTTAAVAESESLSESGLWQRAYAFIGDPEDERFMPEPPRGRFSFSDVPPSPVQDIPVHNSLAPLSTDQVNLLIGEEEKPKKAAKATPLKKQPPPKTRERIAPSAGTAPLRRLLVLVVVVAVVGTLGWALFRFDLTPTAVRDLHPIVATSVAETHLRVAPAPTAFPAPSWLTEATDNRYANRITQSEGFLRQGIASEPDNLIARFMLSDVLREQAGLESESLTVAEEAAGRVRTIEERAYAAQALVWAIAAQPDIGADDLALAQVTAEQAVAEVPNSPHAQWARAMYAALTGNAGEAENAASLATTLDASLSSRPAIAKARQAEVAYRAGHWELAIQLYEQALQEIDYVPWRANLIVILRENGEEERALSHLATLRATDPEHPLLESEIEDVEGEVE